MVQFIQLPESTPGQLSRALGTAFSQGMAQNLPNPQLQLQGRQQQTALQNFKNAINGTETPAEISLKWSESMSGVPGADQLTNTVLPQFQKQAYLNWLLNPQAGQGGQPGQIPQSMNQSMFPGGNAATQMALGNEGVQNNASLQQMLYGPQNSMQGQITPLPNMQQGNVPQGGFNPRDFMLANLMKIPYQEFVNAKYGVPQAKAATQLQEAQIEQQTAREDYASKHLFPLKEGQNEPVVDNDRLNLFMRLGKRYENLNLPNWFRETQRDLNRYQNAKTQIEKMMTPGTKELGALTNIFRGSKYREDTINRMRPWVKEMADLGEEGYIRSMLKDMELSPAEIEMLIFPMDQSGFKNANSLPRTPYQSEDVAENILTMRPRFEDVKEGAPEMYDQITDKYADFLLNNLKPGVSLLGTREYLRKNKNLDWRQFNDALARAEQKGLKLTGDQSGERAELTYAPRDSLAYIFQGWGNWMDWAQGKK